jgi:Na+/melibiose symporter-like transporter
MFILNMSYRLIKMLIPFFVFISFTFLYLCKIEQSLGFGVHDPDHEFRDIPNKALRLMFQDYRSANGQKVIPTLDSKLSATLDNAPFFFVIMLVLVTLFWVFQNAFFLYYITHFMAQLFHGYEETYP